MTYHRVVKTHTSKEKERRSRHNELKRHAMKHRNLSSTTHRIPMYSSPHLGWFRHAPPINKRWHRPTSFECSSRSVLPTLKEKSSPYVGFLRHSPPSNTSFSREGPVDLKHNVPSMSKDKKDKVVEYLNSLALCTHISGRLPGGSPTGYSNAFYTFFDLAFENAKRNQNKSSSHSSSKESHDSIELLRSLGLVPMAFDDRNPSTCRDHKFFDNVKNFMDNFVLPFLASLMKRILFGQEHRLGFNHSLGICEISHWDDVFDDNVGSSVSTHKVEHNHTEIDENSPLYTSISSSAKAYHAEKARQDVSESISLSDTENTLRHLDIESILKLPIITYRTDKEESTADFESSRQESKGENYNELEWSWINVPKHTIEDSDDKKLISEVKPKEEKSQCQQGERKTEGSDNEHCIICLEPFQDGDRLRLLPCNHLFHTSCIDKWLSGSFSYEECITSGCPTCKKTPYVENEQLDTEICEVNPDGTVPSWAFASLGGSLAANAFD